MNSKTILITGLRLIAILNALYFKELKKDEIKQVLKEKYGIEKISDETIKLDINSLIQKGFKIKRPNKGNGYKYQLDKEFSLFKLNLFESQIMKLVKDIAIETLDFKNSIYLNRFYNKIKNLADERVEADFCDFKHFNLLDFEVLKKINNAYNSSCPVKFVYKSGLDEIKEAEVYINGYSYNHNRIYIYCNRTENKEQKVFRADKLIGVEAKDTKGKAIRREKNKKFVYKIKKEFCLKNPLEKFEKELSKDDEGVYVEAGIENKFFVIQRILLLGKNCIEIKDKSLKNELLKQIEEIRGVYL